MKTSSASSGLIRLRVSRSIETKVRKGHPWVFGNSITSQNREGRSGELAALYDHSDQFLAIGLFDPDSPIRLRILHRGKPRTLKDPFWSERISSALARREKVADAQTNGLRWIYGENDGLPGLVVDGYDRTLVMKCYSAAWFPWINTIKNHLIDQLSPERIILRLSRNLRNQGTFQEGSILHGSRPTAPVVFQETGILFQADVLRGQKTGFFLDQRENRREVETLAKGRSVLNAFCYSGGFSLYAARGGAQKVTSIDQSPHALAELGENRNLNASEPSIRDCPRDEIQADVFSWLPQSPQKYGLVIIDPPSLASRKEDIPAALHAYERLVEAGLRATESDGILVMCSCSSHIHRSPFQELVQRSISKSKRRAEIINVTGHPPDHPEGIPELNYLKAAWIRVKAVLRS